jgi:hypothetical protein
MVHSPIPSVEHAHEFFEILGRCIAAWSHIDDELFRIFTECVGPHEQCSIIFFRLPGLDARLKLTDEVVRSLMPKRTRVSGGHDHPSVKGWSQRYKEIDSLLPTRRRIAHHPVTYRYELALIDQRGKPPLVLEVKAGEHERLRSKDNKGLDRDDLVRHLTHVYAAANNLNEFSRTVLSPLLEERARS